MRYFVQTDESGDVLGVATSDGATYPDMEEVEQQAYADALAALSGGTNE